jgi:hypothetical protein
MFSYGAVACIHKANVSQTGDAMNCLTEAFKENNLSESVFETYKTVSPYEFGFGGSITENEPCSTSYGVSEKAIRITPNASPPSVLSGVQFRTRLDSRLKHAGMTVFEEK